MTMKELIQTAQALGIKLTNAEEGTELYRAWADRVEQAEEHDLDLNFARNQRGSEAREYTQEFSAKRDAAVADANRYAI